MGSYVAAWFYCAMAAAGAQMVCYSAYQLARLWIVMSPEEIRSTQFIDVMGQVVAIGMTIALLVLGLLGTAALHYFLGLLPGVPYAIKGWPFTSFLVLGFGFLSVLSVAQDLTHDSKKAKKESWRRT